jgi:hypothetical protein
MFMQQTEENQIVGEAGNVAINKILRGQGKDQRRGGLPHELSDQVFFFLSQAAGRV